MAVMLPSITGLLHAVEDGSVLGLGTLKGLLARLGDPRIYILGILL